MSCGLACFVQCKVCLFFYGPLCHGALKPDPIDSVCNVCPGTIYIAITYIKEYTFCLTDYEMQDPGRIHCLS